MSDSTRGGGKGDGTDRWAARVPLPLLGYDDFFPVDHADAQPVNDLLGPPDDHEPLSEYDPARWTDEAWLLRHAARLGKIPPTWDVMKPQEKELWVRRRQRAKDRKRRDAEEHAHVGKLLALKYRMLEEHCTVNLGLKWTRIVGLPMTLLTYAGTEWVTAPREVQVQVVERAVALAAEFQAAAWKNKDIQWLHQNTDAYQGGGSWDGMPLRVVFENVVCFGNLSEVIAWARHKKGWGKLQAVEPLQPDDPIDRWRLTCTHKEGSPYQERIDQRRDLKKLLGRYKKLVGIAWDLALYEWQALCSGYKEVFARDGKARRLEHYLDSMPGWDLAGIIRQRAGVGVDSFWRLVKGVKFDPELGRKSGRLVPLQPGLFEAINAEADLEPFAETEEERPAPPRPKKVRRKVDLGQPSLFGGLREEEPGVPLGES